MGRIARAHYPWRGRVAPRTAQDPVKIVEMELCARGWREQSQGPARGWHVAEVGALGILSVCDGSTVPHVPRDAPESPRGAAAGTPFNVCIS